MKRGKKRKRKANVAGVGEAVLSLSTIPPKKAPVIAYGDSREITPPDRNQTILQWPPYGIGNGKKWLVIGRSKLGMEKILHCPKSPSHNASPYTVSKLAGLTYVRWQMGGPSASTTSTSIHGPTYPPVVTARHYSSKRDSALHSLRENSTRTKNPNRDSARSRVCGSTGGTGVNHRGFYWLKVALIYWETDVGVAVLWGSRGCVIYFWIGKNSVLVRTLGVHEHLKMSYY